MRLGQGFRHRRTLPTFRTMSDQIRVETPPARLVLFGFSPTQARVETVARTRSWRVTRALFIGLATLGLTPLVALVPPHVPWALLALGSGGLLAVRRLREQATLRAFEGNCPRCGAFQTIESPVRLRDPHRFPCSACHHDLTLEVNRRDGATPLRGAA